MLPLRPVLAWLLALAISGAVAAAQPQDDVAPGEREIEATEPLVQDEVIATLVETRLMAHREIDKLRLQVQSKDGNVTLRGPFPDRETAETAIALAKQVDGVRDVRVEQGRSTLEAEQGASAAETAPAQGSVEDTAPPQGRVDARERPQTRMR